MMPPPGSVGLILSENLIIEVGSNNVTLVNCFSFLRGEVFPFQMARIVAYAALTGSQGDATMELVLSELESGDEINRWQTTTRFMDRFAETRVGFRLSDLVFPSPGVYQFTLLADGDWVAQRRLEVFMKEGPR
jgi:hypothetical protein